jgi:carboxyl-terminal processing protease
METFKEPITRLINTEIIRRYYYQKGVAKYDLQYDREVSKAIEVLSDPQLYKTTLSAPDKTKETAEN